MIEFGKDLRSIRESKGLSVADIAERTHMMSSMVDDLENENFNRIVAPIYGRGFVKLYCDALGVDPKPYVEEFMAIFTGNRDPAIRERPTTKSVPVTEPAPATEPSTVSVPEPEIPQTIVDEPLPAPQTLIEESTESAEEESEPTSAPTPRFTSYSAPLRGRSSDLPALGPTLIRWGVLLFGAIVVLWLLIAGIRALYRATTRPTETMPVVQEEVVETPVAPVSETKPTSEPRTPLEIPPLYID